MNDLSERLWKGDAIDGITEIEDLREFARDAVSEIVRLREALEALVLRSNNDSIGTAKVIDMRDIAMIALEQAK